jgi:hypothetical protein
MKNILTTILVVVVLTLIITSVAMAERKKGFDGAWEAIDSIDGSYQIMVIQDEDDHYIYNDFAATIGCPPDNPAVLEGNPFVDGNSLTVTGKIVCLYDSGPVFLREEPYTFNFTYFKNSDTIYGDLAGFEDTWNRIEKK